MSKNFSDLILEANVKSYEMAFETAVRTGTALIYTRNGKVVEIRPPYRYELVPIKEIKKRFNRSKKR
jgi:hypothetical protein